MQNGGVVGSLSRKIWVHFARKLIGRLCACHCLSIQPILVMRIRQNKNVVLIAKMTEGLNLAKMIHTLYINPPKTHTPTFWVH